MTSNEHGRNVRALNRVLEPAGSERLAKLVEAASDATPVGGLTHNFYRYPARFSPKLARAAIEAFSEPGDLVLDPFVGGGTTLVEAMVLGRDAIGADISSLATFVSEVKTTLYTEPELDALTRWGNRVGEAINVFASVGTGKYQNVGYLRHLDGIATWRLRKAIDQALGSAKRRGTPRLRAFARCAILRTAQWALDGRKKLPTISDFRDTLFKNTEAMIKGSRDLREYKPSEQRSIQGIGAAAVFLNPDELALLTGFHRKGRQVEQLRRMGIAFYVNGCGRPVVARAAIEGSAAGASPRTWAPSVVKLARGA